MTLYMLNMCDPFPPTLDFKEAMHHQHLYIPGMTLPNKEVNI